jgi:hypothetical protein
MPELGEVEGAAVRRLPADLHLAALGHHGARALVGHLDDELVVAGDQSWRADMVAEIDQLEDA